MQIGLFALEIALREVLQFAHAPGQPGEALGYAHEAQAAPQIAPAETSQAGAAG